MKKRFSEEQIFGFLRETEAGMPVKELCRRRALHKLRHTRHVDTDRWGHVHLVVSLPLTPNRKLNRRFEAHRRRLLHRWNALRHVAF